MQFGLHDKNLSVQFELSHSQGGQVEGSKSSLPMGGYRSSSIIKWQSGRQLSSCGLADNLDWNEH